MPHLGGVFLTPTHVLTLIFDADASVQRSTVRRTMQGLMFLVTCASSQGEKFSNSLIPSKKASINPFRGGLARTGSLRGVSPAVEGGYDGSRVANWSTTSKFVEFHAKSQKFKLKEHA